MLDAKTAIKIAVNYMAEIFSQYSDFEVEEIELSDDKTHWSITVSMPDNSNKPALAIISGLNRKYKKIIIDNNTHQVKGMQIRKI